MKTKREWEKLWEKAPIGQFLNYRGLDAEDLKDNGVIITDDWARAMYLFQVYSGGGYMSALIGITAFWSALRCRCKVPYRSEIANLFYEEQFAGFCHNRDVPTLLKVISEIVGSSDFLDRNGELYSILEVIREKTGVELKKIESEDIKRCPPVYKDLPYIKHIMLK